MGPTNIIFIVVLLLVAGFVAWAGDVLGSLLGKRRISLFGLRPRLTSRLIGVLTGIIITVATIITLALTSERIQMMLLRMDDIIRENAGLESKNTRLVEENRNLEIEQVRIIADVAEKDLRIEGLQTDITNRQEQFLRLAGQLSSVEEELTGLNEEIEDLTGDRDRLQAEYEASEADLSAQIADLNQQIADRETRVADLNTQIASLEQEVHRLETGEFKVRENQQLVVFSIDTSQTVDRIYGELQARVDGISATYRDPVTGETVLAENDIEITSEQYVDALEDIRSISSDRAIVIAYATENVVENQPVPVRLEVTTNNRVYREGNLIYSNTYSEPVGIEQPYRAIFARFFEDARNHLVNERSLIPITSGEALQLTIDDLLGLSERLAEAGLPAELRIIALTDIYRTDFLVYGQQFAVTILPVGSPANGTAPE